MSVDVVARGLALQARPVATTATGIASVSVPAPVQAIQTSGYATAGRGAGLYVCDAMANAALAAAHPRFCKQSADGRYWRLSVEGGLNVLAAGAVADNTTDDGPVFAEAIAYLAAHAATLTYGFSIPTFRIPWGRYYLGTTTLEFRNTVIVEGMNGGGYSNSASYLRWAAATTGIRTHRYNTTGATGTNGAIYPATNAAGTIIRNLTLYGGYAGTESESHGIHIRETTHVENCFILNFAGDGVYANCNVGGATTEGQSSASQFTNVMVQTCRNGYYFDGVDSNTLNFFNCRAQSNRRYGAWHVLGLQINWFGGLFATNGTGGTPTMCNHNGYRYYVLPGQATGASTNAPSGTNTNNTWWGVQGIGGSHPDFPNWVSGMSLRDGGAFRADGTGQSGTIVGTYWEGDHAPFIIEAQYTCMVSNANGAFRAVKLNGDNYGGRLGGGTNGLGVTGRFDVTQNLVVQGNAMIGSQDPGVVADGEMFLDSTNVYNWFRFRHNGTIQNTLMSYAGTLYLDTTNGGFLRQAGNAIATWTAAGLLVPYAGAKLGYDTGAGGAVTQATSRTTGVTINKACGQITLVSAAGSTSWQTFTVTNSVVAAGDVVRVVQKSGADKYMIHVTAVAAGSFAVTFATTGGTTTEQPVFSFAVLKAVAA